MDDDWGELEPHQERMLTERSELADRLTKLDAMLSKPRPEFIDGAEWSLMRKQALYMRSYHAVLNQRIKAW